MEEAVLATQSASGKAPGVRLLATGAGLTVTLLAACTACWFASTLPGAGAFAHNWLNLFSPRSGFDGRDGRVIQLGVGSNLWRKSH